VPVKARASGALIGSWPPGAAAALPFAAVDVAAADAAGDPDDDAASDALCVLLLA
jgi:hypothetical protein